MLFNKQQFNFIISAPENMPGIFFRELLVSMVDIGSKKGYYGKNYIL